MNPNFTRYRCWDEAQIGRVINKEAVSVEGDLFLATHLPFEQITYVRSPRQMASTSEEGLLEELIEYGGKDRHFFGVVQGIPGTGKSHLIRWLKERYHQSGQNDVVLLIERANCTLRGTLEQLIRSGVFDEATMGEDIKRLHGAREALSHGALAETLLNHLQVATQEVSLPTENQPPSRITRNVRHFLLDVQVRALLKRPGGPVERLLRYIASTEGGVPEGDYPGFEATDFEFDVDARRAIAGYREARELAEDLDLKPALRDRLAGYLNELLEYALGQTLSLSVDDLKRLFFDLRRELRRQGRGLALFIEDITAFTGLDRGLIDVLATQHTGEANRELCRLISVLGITDSYYNSQFPDNLKERVTHHLTLNAAENQSSHLLQSSEALTQMAGRYLNAMRLRPEVLAAWRATSGTSRTVPSACDCCLFKEPCHASFGAVALSDGEESSRLGLYPFNDRALRTMYEGLDPTRVSRTPRTFLNSVLSYVLQSHGYRVEMGTFPPPPAEMGSDFRAPILKSFAQRATLQRQGGAASSRLESLLLYWGDRTANATGDGEGRRVGTLSETVFVAFDLPFIQGEEGTSGRPSPGLPPSPASVVNAPTTGDPPARPVPAPSAVEPEDPLAALKRDVNEWLNGKPLQQYERVVRALEPFLAGAIDWEAHGVSPAQVSDRLKAGRIYIEGQMGRMRTTEYLQFNRSQEMAEVIIGLMSLSERLTARDPGSVGSSLITVGAWLRREEGRVVDFVRRASINAEDEIPLLDLLLWDNLLLAWLEGKLSPRATSPLELLTVVIQTAFSTESSQQWQTARLDGEAARSVEWGGLVRELARSGAEADRIRAVKAGLRQILNRAQGGSSDIRFLDAAQALDRLDALLETEWALPPPATSRRADPMWTPVQEIYQSFYGRFEGVLAAEGALIRQRTTHIRALMGERSANEVLDAVNQLRLLFTEHTYFRYPLPPPPSFSGKVVEQTLATAEQERMDRQQMILFLASAGTLLERLAAQEGFFDQVHSLLVESQQDLDKTLERLRAEQASMQHQEALDAYGSVESQLTVAREVLQ